MTRSRRRTRHALVVAVCIASALQYIINPGGTGKIPNALVLGFQLLTL